jgi:hypothetical protein
MKMREPSKRKGNGKCCVMRNHSNAKWASNGRSDFWYCECVVKRRIVAVNM